MPKFKCCRQTFLNRILLQEHVSTHPPNWGKRREESSSQNIFQNEKPPHLTLMGPPPPPLPFPTPPTTPEYPKEFLETSLSPPVLVPPQPLQTSSQIHQPKVQTTTTQFSAAKQAQTTSEQKIQRPLTSNEVEKVVESPLESDPSRESWREWNCALGTLFEERGRLSHSPADAFYWDLALNTLVSLRNNYYQTVAKNGQKFTTAPQKRFIVPVEEHNDMIKQIDDVRQERDALKVKWEESETRRRVLEQIEKEYKTMLSVRTEEVFRAKKLISESSSESKNFSRALTATKLPHEA